MKRLWKEVNRIANAMWKQVAIRRVHENPMLAVVGANPATRGGKYLGDVRRIFYLRKIGQHKNRRFQHAFKRTAKMYAMPDGSIRVVG